MTLMRKLTLNFCHSQTCGLVKVRVLGLVPPTCLFASGLGPGHVVMPNLSHAVTPVIAALEPLFLWEPIITAKPKWQ